MKTSTNDSSGGDSGLAAHSEPQSPHTTKSLTPVLKVGMLYHVYGWNYKAQFKLISFDKRWATVVTPVGGIPYTVARDKLFYTKKTKRKLAQLTDLPLKDEDLK